MEATKRILYTFGSLKIRYTYHIIDKNIREALLSEKCSFFNIVQKAFDPPPLLFEHLSYFAGGVFRHNFWTWVELAMSFETDMKYM